MALGAGQLYTAISFLVGKNEVPQATEKNAAGLERMAHAAGKANTAVGQLAGAFTGMVAAGWIQRGMTAIVKPAADLELSLKNLQVLTGANAEAMAKYQAEAFRVAAITPYNALQMVDAMTKLRQVTGDQTAAMKALEPASQLAMASFGKLTIEKSTEMVGQMVRGFRLAGEEIPLATEKVASGTVAMGLQIQDVSNIMGRLSMAATRGEQSFDEILKMMLITRRVIPSQEMAATAINRVAAALADVKKQAALAQIGVQTIDPATGRIRAMSSIMLDLATRYQTGAVVTRNAINQAFGERAVLPIIATLQQLTQGMTDNAGNVHKMGDVYSFLTEKLRGNTSVLKELSDAYKESTAGRIEEMLNQVQNLAVSLGTLLFPAVQSAASVIGVLADAFRAVTAIPLLSGTIGIILRFGSGILIVWGLVAAFDGFRRVLSVVNANVLAATGNWHSFRVGIGLVRIQMQHAAATSGVFAAALVGVREVAFTVGAALKGLVASVRTFLTSMGPVGWALFIISLVPEVISSLKDAWKTTIEYWKDDIRGWSAWLTEELKRGTTTGKLLDFFLPSLKQVKLIEDAQAQARKLQEESAKKTQEILREGGKQLYDYMQLGSKEMNKVVDELKGIINYKPKAADWGMVYQVQSMAREAAKKKLTPEQRAGMEGIQRAGKFATRLAFESQRRTLLPHEKVDLETALTYMQAEASEFGIKGVAGFTPGLGERFGKKVVSPILEASSGAAMARAKLLAAGRGGVFETGRLPGWNELEGDTVTGAMVAAGTHPPQFRRQKGILPPGRPGETPFKIKRESLDFSWAKDIQRQDRAIQTEVERTVQHQQLLKTLNGNNEQLLKRLNGTLDVQMKGEGAGKDPLTGGGAGGVFSDTEGGYLGGR